MKKPIIIIAVSTLVICLVAIAVVATLLATRPTKNTDAETSIVHSKAKADELKTQADQAATAGESKKALDLFKQAREEYSQVDQAAGILPSAPSPEVVEIDAQINLLETVPAPTATPQKESGEFPLIGDQKKL